MSGWSLFRKKKPANIMEACFELCLRSADNLHRSKKWSKESQFMMEGELSSSLLSESAHFVTPLSSVRSGCVTWNYGFVFHLPYSHEKGKLTSKGKVVFTLKTADATKKGNLRCTLDLNDITSVGGMSRMDKQLTLTGHAPTHTSDVPANTTTMMFTMSVRSFDLAMVGAPTDYISPMPPSPVELKLIASLLESKDDGKSPPSSPRGSPKFAGPTSPAKQPLTVVAFPAAPTGGPLSPTQPVVFSPSQVGATTSPLVLTKGHETKTPAAPSKVASSSSSNNNNATMVTVTPPPTRLTTATSSNQSTDSNASQSPTAATSTLSPPSQMGSLARRPSDGNTSSPSSPTHRTPVRAAINGSSHTCPYAKWGCSFVPSSHDQLVNHLTADAMVHFTLADKRLATTEDALSIYRSREAAATVSGDDNDDEDNDSNSSNNSNNDTRPSFPNGTPPKRRYASSKSRAATPLRPDKSFHIDVATPATGTPMAGSPAISPTHATTGYAPASQTSPGDIVPDLPSSSGPTPRRTVHHEKNFYQASPSAKLHQFAGVMTDSSPLPERPRTHSGTSTRRPSFNFAGGPPNIDGGRASQLSTPVSTTSSGSNSSSSSSLSFVPSGIPAHPISQLTHSGSRENLAAVANGDTATRDRRPSMITKGTAVSSPTALAEIVESTVSIVFPVNVDTSDAKGTLEALYDHWSVGCIAASCQVPLDPPMPEGESHVEGSGVHGQTSAAHIGRSPLCAAHQGLAGLDIGPFLSRTPAQWTVAMEAAPTVDTLFPLRAIMGPPAGIRALSDDETAFLDQFIAEDGLRLVSDILGNRDPPSPDEVRMEALCLLRHFVTPQHIEAIIDTPALVEHITLGLVSEDLVLKKTTLELLAVLCWLGPAAHGSVVSALVELEVHKKGASAFPLLGTCVGDVENLDLQVVALVFLNSLINSSATLDDRLVLRRELLLVGVLATMQNLEDFIAQQQDVLYDELSSQLVIFDRSMMEDKRLTTIEGLDHSDATAVYTFLEETCAERGLMRPLLSILHALVCVPRNRDGDTLWNTVQWIVSVATQRNQNEGAGGAEHVFRPSARPSVDMSILKGRLEAKMAEEKVQREDLVQELRIKIAKQRKTVHKARMKAAYSHVQQKTAAKRLEAFMKETRAEKSSWHEEVMKSREEMRVLEQKNQSLLKELREMSREAAGIKNALSPVPSLRSLSAAKPPNSPGPADPSVPKAGTKWAVVTASLLPPAASSLSSSPSASSSSTDTPAVAAPTRGAMVDMEVQTDDEWIRAIHEAKAAAESSANIPMAPPMDGIPAAPDMDIPMAPPFDAPPMDGDVPMAPPFDAPPMDGVPMAPPFDAPPMDGIPMAPDMDGIPGAPPFDAPPMDGIPMAPDMDGIPGAPPFDAPPMDGIPMAPDMNGGAPDAPPFDAPPFDAPPMDGIPAAPDMGGIPPPPPMDGIPPPPPMNSGAPKGRAAVHQPKPLYAVRKAIKPKSAMRKFHWKKREANDVKGTVWAELAKEEDEPIDVEEFERTFCQTAPKAKVASGDGDGKGAAAEVKEVKKKEEKKPELVCIEGRRSYNVTIAISRLKLASDILRDAILMMDSTVLTLDRLDQLTKVIPTPEEQKQIKEFGETCEDPVRMGACEKFFFALCNIKRLDRRIELCLFQQQFASQVHDVQDALAVVERAETEIRESKALPVILRVILAMGNHMNGGTAKGQAYGFELGAILAVRSSKSCDNKMTLMDYVVAHNQKRSSVAESVGTELRTMEQATRVEGDAVSGAVNALREKVKKLKAELKLAEKEPPAKDAFFTVMNPFYEQVDRAVTEVEERRAKLDTAIRDLMKLYGEDFEKQKWEEFFTIFKQFIDMYRESQAKIAKQKQAEMDAKRKADAKKEAEAKAKAKADGKTSGVGSGGMNLGRQPKKSALAGPRELKDNEVVDLASLKKNKKPSVWDKVANALHRPMVQRAKAIFMFLLQRRKDRKNFLTQFRKKVLAPPEPIRYDDDEDDDDDMFSNDLPSRGVSFAPSVTFGAETKEVKKPRKGVSFGDESSATGPAAAKGGDDDIVRGKAQKITKKPMFTTTTMRPGMMAVPRGGIPRGGVAAGDSRRAASVIVVPQGQQAATAAALIGMQPSSTATPTPVIPPMPGVPVKRKGGAAAAALAARKQAYATMRPGQKMDFTAWQPSKTNIAPTPAAATPATPPTTSVAVTGAAMLTPPPSTSGATAGSPASTVSPATPHRRTHSRNASVTRMVLSPSLATVSETGGATSAASSGMASPRATTASSSSPSVAAMGGMGSPRTTSSAAAVAAAGMLSPKSPAAPSVAASGATGEPASPQFTMSITPAGTPTPSSSSTTASPAISSPPQGGNGVTGAKLVVPGQAAALPLPGGSHHTNYRHTSGQRLAAAAKHTSIREKLRNAQTMRLTPHESKATTATMQAIVRAHAAENKLSSAKLQGLVAQTGAASMMAATGASQGKKDAIMDLLKSAMEETLSQCSQCTCTSFKAGRVPGYCQSCFHNH